VIAEHQLLRVRIEVELTRQIRYLKHPDVVAHERQRHDERYETTAIVGDRLIG
jgi:hypothetical protein